MNLLEKFNPFRQIPRTLVRVGFIPRWLQNGALFSILLKIKKLAYRYLNRVRLWWVFPQFFRLEVSLYLRQRAAVASEFHKNLYASAINKDGKQYLLKIIQQFGHDDFDYLLFVYDRTELTEDVFKRCTIIYDKGFKWYFAKKYLTPRWCAQYDYIFFWDDDIDADGFSCVHFLEIMKRNNMEMAQPALRYDSYYFHEITRQHGLCRVGRFTDFVENMVPVFRRDAWNKYWEMLEKEYNYWGWGYDDMAFSICGFKNVGIVDCEAVRHVKPMKYNNPKALEDLRLFYKNHHGYKRAQRICYKELI